LGELSVKTRGLHNRFCRFATSNAEVVAFQQHKIGASCKRGLPLIAPFLKELLEISLNLLYHNF